MKFMIKSWTLGPAASSFFLSLILIFLGLSYFIIILHLFIAVTGSFLVLQSCLRFG